MHITRSEKIFLISIISFRNVGFLEDYINLNENIKLLIIDPK